MRNSFVIPNQATNAEKWILLVLMQTGTMKETKAKCRITIRRVQQVVKKYQIDVSKLQPAIHFACTVSKEK